MDNSDLSSEQYADWSVYLNDFAASKGTEYAFHPSKDEFNALLERNGLSALDEYTVFMKKGKATYYYDGVIVEPMVYVAVDKSYAQQPLTDMDEAFLPEATNASIIE